MLLDEHFETMRERFNSILRRNTDNLNRWVTTDLRYIDAESKTAAQVRWPLAVAVVEGSVGEGGGAGGARSRVACCTQRVTPFCLLTTYDAGDCERRGAADGRAEARQGEESARRRRCSARAEVTTVAAWAAAVASCVQAYS